MSRTRSLIRFESKVNKEYKMAIRYFEKRDKILYKAGYLGAQEVLVKVIVKLYKGIRFDKY